MILNAWCKPSSPLTICSCFLPLMQTSSNLLELFTWESPHRLSTHTPLCNSTKYQASRCLIIRSFCNHYIIVLPHNKIEPYQLSSSISCSSIKRVQTFRSIFDFLDSLFSEIDQANVGWHMLSSHFVS